MTHMQRTIEATIDAKGKVELSEPVRLSSKRRALVTILDEEPNEKSVQAGLPLTGEELVEYWEKEGIFGSRPDIKDSQQHAREIRRQAERRRGRSGPKTGSR